MRVAINGFGRIGRCAFKIALDNPEVKIVAINDLANLDDLAYLLKYDSVHGWYPRKVTTSDNYLIVDNNYIPFFNEKDPSRLPWETLEVDVVLECSGALRKGKRSLLHLEAGAKYVIISAPSDDADITVILGINDDKLNLKSNKVISMASCTTNSIAPVAKVLDEHLGVNKMMITTVHAYTSSQSLMDIPARKRRRARAAAVSIIPTTTGATKATEKVLPQLKNKMAGLALRVPVVDGSITDMVFILQKTTTAEEINSILEEASNKPPLKGIMRVSWDEIVSRDIIGDPHSSVVDAPSTVCLGNMAKVLAWYDNEWGYASRLIDLIKRMEELMK